MTPVEIKNKFSELKAMFPHGKYWNHEEDTIMNLNTVSNTMCGEDGYTCNGFGGGYTLMLFTL